MTRPLKPYEIPLTVDLAAEILNIPYAGNLQGPPLKTLGEHLDAAREMIVNANQILAASPVAKIVATSLARDLKKRGDAFLEVRLDGTVVLRVVYNEGQDEKEIPARVRKDAPSVTCTHGSELPYLDELRQEAVERGIDISDLGRQRRAIYERLRRR